MSKNQTQKYERIQKSDLKIVLIPASKENSDQSLRLDEIQEAAARIILLSKKRGRPKESSEDSENAA